MVPSPDALIVRSAVQSSDDYLSYRDQLKHDCFYSCAYCFISENEARGIPFEIDHYLPKSKRPELGADYGNLFYSCKICNNYKGDQYPDEHNEQDGYRFFKSDIDFFGDHYKAVGIRIEYKTKIGHFTRETLNLNRLSLRRLRDLRKRVALCDDQLAMGMLWLRSFHTDNLPQELRVEGRKLIADALAKGGDAVNSTSDLIRTLNRSELLVQDESAEMKERKRRLNLLRTKMAG